MEWGWAAVLRARGEEGEAVGAPRSASGAPPARQPSPYDCRRRTALRVSVRALAGWALQPGCSSCSWSWRQAMGQSPRRQGCGNRHCIATNLHQIYYHLYLGRCPMKVCGAWSIAGRLTCGGSVSPPPRTPGWTPGGASWAAGPGSCRMQARTGTSHRSASSPGRRRRCS